MMNAALPSGKVHAGNIFCICLLAWLIIVNWTIIAV